MEISFLIVTKNRPEELEFTLTKLQIYYDSSCHEVLVLIDGCPETEVIKEKYPWVQWYSLKESISASPARNFLYQKAIGEILIGLDDDANLISEKPIETIQSYFNANQNLGILAFKEVKGIFKSNSEINLENEKEEFLTTEFIGSGFAIRKKVYDETNGFPIWMDIYGEETCVSLEVMDLGYDILYSNQVAVNHRIDVEKRKLQGKNYFRFQKQLQNSFRIYLVYYQYPLKKITKLLFHNFKKYALSDWIYFKLFFKAVVNMFLVFFVVMKFRKSINNVTLLKLKQLQSIKY
jgi:GT2 family glycosyltransferase